MSSDAQDIAVARHVKQAGLATAEQLAGALQAQGQALERGERISLVDALHRVGAITPAQREMLEEKTRPQKAGGQQLLQYKLLKKLGEGGMGTVYLAEDTSCGEKFALKVLSRKQAADADFLNRFRREAEAAGKLDHPNIVRAYKAGEDLGYHFYVMEYCEGESLEKGLERQGLLPWRKALEIVLQTARGLGYAHERGFVHRDIKPANILVTANGAVKILDLGLSKRIDESQVSSQTVSGVVLGTPHYISPEQAKGEKVIDGRADIYSLGATLYHFLAGEPPFEGKTLYEILSKHVNAELPNPQDLAEEIPEGPVQVLRKMMAKEPKDRYADCGELISDLELVLEGKEPKSQALHAGASSVALFRKRIEGARRRKAGTYRSVRRKRTKTIAPFLWAGAAAGLLVLVLAIVLTSGPSRVEPMVHVPKRPGREPLAPPAPPVLPLPVAQGPSRDELAKEELGKVVLFKGLAPDDTESRIGRLEAFVREYQDTFAAAQARAKLHELKKPLRVSARPADDAFIREVARLTPENQVLRVMGKLKELNPGFDDRETHIIENGRVRHLSFLGIALTDISPLRALPDLTHLTCTGGYDPSTQWAIKAALTDLSPLEGLPLTYLAIQHTNVRDLSPLKRMRLGWLYCTGTPVSDLSPLNGMPLKTLFCSNTSVRDLSPLRGMQVERLQIPDGIQDLSPLGGTPLKELWLHFSRKHHPAILRSIPTLERINGIPVTEFWRRLKHSGDRLATGDPSSVTTLKEGLVGWWRLEGGKDRIAADSSGHRHHGTLTKGAWWSSGPDGSRFAGQKVLELDGKNGYVILPPNLPILRGVRACSLSVWVRPDTLPAVKPRSIVSLSQFSKTGPTRWSRAAVLLVQGIVEVVGMPRDTGRRDGFSMSRRTTTRTTVRLITIGKWHHIVALIDYAGDRITVYVDGLARATDRPVVFPASVTPDTPSTCGALGKQDDGSDPSFDGRLADVRVYNRLLTPSEVRALYALPPSGTGRDQR